MLQPSKTKICLVGDCLSGGGAERVHAFLSDYFVQQGIRVHNVIVTDNVTYDYSGELLNLGKLKNSYNGVFNKLKRLLVLKRFIQQQQFDYIIDFRMRKKPLQDFFIAKLIYTTPAVYTVHSANINWYMPAQSWFTRAIYGRAYGVVSVTQKMESLIKKRHGLTNVVTIYNPVNINYIQGKLIEALPETGFNYIVAAGSMGHDNIKQFDKLIEAYAQSVLPAAAVKLLVLGRGSEESNLKQLAKQKGLADKVVFMGFQENPYVYMQKALFFVLSSRFEGLPMVLLESLACGTPAVAFDCFSGPSEIITDEYNGLLIENQNMQKLTEGINRMFTDNVLRNYCRQNAPGSTAKFTLETVGQQWMEYLKIEMKNI